MHCCELWNNAFSADLHILAYRILYYIGRRSPYDSQPIWGQVDSSLLFDLNVHQYKISRIWGYNCSSMYTHLNDAIHKYVCCANKTSWSWLCVDYVTVPSAPPWSWKILEPDLHTSKCQSNLVPDVQYCSNLKSTCRARRWRELHVTQGQIQLFEKGGVKFSETEVSHFFSPSQSNWLFFTR
jgi:hypothetical protein